MATVAFEPATGKEEPKLEAPKLSELLNETRILLPGTEVFLGFLATLPFTQQFTSLDGPRRVAYICTFFATLLALVLFVVPAAYHRIARPIHDKDAFKELATLFLIAGLVPMSIAMVLASYLVTYVVFDGVALYLSGAVAVLIIGVWWVVPLVRAHHHYVGRKRRASEERGAPPRTSTPGDTGVRDRRSTAGLDGPLG